ncbi:hypothetical protein [Solirubrum puertoriconensis]|uniref:ATPase n=1 Tax=Solirubrum puertoriconensis TaxID=1751427 RepID=A0A9X0HJF5_SOLP1|nr:hypothetical protein [Solirubrum puertoriconensis]KUG06903.1 hypothetical protein ASU33_06145 [Solirubrum puertoriconensis]
MTITAISNLRPVLPSSPADTVLSEEEAAAALAAARQAKWDALRMAQYRWDVANPPKPETFTAEQIYQIKLYEARQLVPGFSLDNGVEEVFWTLCLYFAGDARFDALRPGYSRRKGLLLMGNVGRGKSFLMKLFMRNPLQGYGVLSTRKVAERYQQQGPEGLGPYLQAGATGVCFDDLGAESTEVKHYANAVNPMAEVLLSRYDELVAGRLQPFATHITTNLSADQIEARYENRVRSRMREMFNTVKFSAEAPDRRA